MQSERDENVTGMTARKCKVQDFWELRGNAQRRGHDKYSQDFPKLS